MKGSDPPSTGHDPWIRYRNSSLYVVPSIHYRQVFAQAVYEACWRRRFDTIALELRSSHNRVGVADAILKLAPSPGLIVFPGDDLGFVPVPVNDHPDCEDVVAARARACSILPVSPSDSMVMALRCPSLLARRWPGWRPDVRFVDLDGCPESQRPGQDRIPDDYEVRVRGLEAFYSRSEEAWQACRIPGVDGPRERAMAARLRRLLDEGREILFVCGGAHWASIRALLDGDVETVGEGEPERGLPLVASLDPSLAWFWGWLDDIPHAVWQFERHCQRDMGRHFEKPRALAGLLKDSVREAPVAGIHASIRHLLLLHRFGARLLSASGRWTADLDNDIVPAAAACIDDRFANLVKEVGLRYPASPPEGIERAQLLVGKEGALFIRVGPHCFALPTTPPGPGRRRRLQIPRALPLSAAEERETRSRGPYLRDWPDEVRLRRIMNLRARELARRGRVRRVRPFQGTLGDGLDWRSTIRSFSRGLDDLYVREDTRRRSVTGHTMLSPVVWIFDDEEPVVSRNSTEQPLTEEDWYQSSLLYIATSSRLAGERIRAFKVAAYVDFFLSRTYAGPGFVDWPPERQKAADMAYLRRVPPEKRCKHAPWWDDEIREFSGADQAIAAAVRYAADEVILVSRSTKGIAHAVLAYAKQRRVTIHRVSIDNFAPARLERFRWFHFVPCPGDTFQPPFEWCRRFVPAI